MAIEEMFTSLPTVSASTMADIICAVQGFVSPSSLGLSTQQTLQQVFNLFQSNVILFNSGNPNGLVAGTTYQFLWDTSDSILWICTTSGTTTTAVWTRANINSGYATTTTAAATTTLTIQSFYWQFFTGSTTQTVIMPVTSTLANGMTWSIVNNSSASVTIQSSGLNNIVVLASGQVALVTCILNSGTSAASWNAIVSAVGGGVTSLAGTAHQVIVSASTGAITLSLPQSIDTTSSPTFAGLTLTAPLPIASGGTGVGSVTILPTATSFAGWDANKNLSANSFIEGYTTIATSASTTTLSVTSTYLNYFTGSTTQTVVLPVTSTLVLGQQFFVANNSSGVVTVQSSGLNNIVAMAANTVATFTVILTSGTSAASWSTDYNATVAGVNSITGTANQLIASSSTGAVVLSLPQNINTAATPTFTNTILSGITPYAVLCGGTSTSTALQSIASLGTLGQSLKSNGAGALPTMKNGGLINIQYLTSGTAATYTPTSGTASILIRAFGGGGGGGGSTGAASSVSAGAGGGAGAYVESFVNGLAATYTYTIGAGGAGGLAGNNTGTSGGATTLNVNSISAGGGIGGSGQTSTATSTSSTCSGGSGGGASSSGLNTPGSSGTNGLVLSGGVVSSGTGGNSFVGAGGKGLTSAAVGNAASGFSAGGGGATSLTVSAAGGNGAGGLIIVYEFN